MVHGECIVLLLSSAAAGALTCLIFTYHHLIVIVFGIKWWDMAIHGGVWQYLYSMAMNSSLVWQRMVTHEAGKGMAWQGMLKYGNVRPLGGLAVGCMAQMGRWSPDISQSTISMSAILYTSSRVDQERSVVCGVCHKKCIVRQYVRLMS